MSDICITVRAVDPHWRCVFHAPAHSVGDSVLPALACKRHTPMHLKFFFFKKKAFTDKVTVPTTFSTCSTPTQKKNTNKTLCTAAEQRPNPRRKRIKPSISWRTWLSEQTELTPQTWGCLIALGIRRAHSFRTPRSAERARKKVAHSVLPSFINDTSINADCDGVFVWEHVGLIIASFRSRRELCVAIKSKEATFLDEQPPTLIPDVNVQCASG